MLKKITQNDIKNLKIGSTIFKYPISGEPTKTIDQNDTEQIKEMEIVNIVIDRVDLRTKDFTENSVISSLKIEITPLYKTKDELVSDELWWIGTS